jgi:hypothetical protein
MQPTRKIFIALPLHDGTLRVGTFTSLIAAMSDLTARGINVHVSCWHNDSLLPHARNVLLGYFMASDCTDMVFVDSDVSWAPGCFDRLLAHDVDFVAGAYRHKGEEESYPVAWLDETDRTVNDKGLIAVAGVPGGFFRMTRAGLERITAQCPDLVYESHNAKGLKCWYLFDIVFADGRAWGEDYVFCKKIRALGETVWLDPSLHLSHAGHKEYRGQMSAFLAAQAAETLPADEKAAHDAKLLAFAQSFNTPEMHRLFAQALGEPTAIPQYELKEQAA